MARRGRLRSWLRGMWGWSIRCAGESLAIHIGLADTHGVCDLEWFTFKK